MSRRKVTGVRGWLVSFVPYAVGIPAILFPILYGWRQGVREWASWSVKIVLVSLFIGASRLAGEAPQKLKLTRYQRFLVGWNRDRTVRLAHGMGTLIRSDGQKPTEA